MLTRRILALGWFGWIMMSAVGYAQEKDSNLVGVTARDIKLKVPATWKQVKSTSTMRAAEFEIPNPESGGESADMVVYYFGGPTGGTRANVQRWIDQFYEEGRQVALVKGQCPAGGYTLVDISGTYKKPDGPPVAQKTIDKPGSRVMGVVLVAEIDGREEYYFLKLSGPDKLVAGQAKALRASFAADAESEKSAKLDDLAD